MSDLLEQKDVNYRSAEEGKGSCASCANYQEPDKCALVEGPVAAAGMCDLYAPKQQDPNELFVGRA